MWGWKETLHDHYETRDNMKQYIKRVKQQTEALESIKGAVYEVKVFMGVLNWPPSRFQNRIVALDALENERKLFILEYVN